MSVQVESVKADFNADDADSTRMTRIFSAHPGSASIDPPLQWRCGVQGFEKSAFIRAIRVIRVEKKVLG